MQRPGNRIVAPGVDRADRDAMGRSHRGGVGPGNNTGLGVYGHSRGRFSKLISDRLRALGQDGNRARVGLGPLHLGQPTDARERRREPGLDLGEHA